MASVRIYPGAIEALVRSRPVQADLERRADNVLRVQQNLCPVDTGRLKASLKKTKTGDGWRIGTDLYYAGYVEFGTRRMRAQPYIRPSISAAAH